MKLRLRAVTHSPTGLAVMPVDVDPPRQRRRHSYVVKRLAATMDGPFVDPALPARGGTSRPRCRAHLVPSDGAGVTGAGGRTPHRGRTMSWPGASRINRFSRLACYSSDSPSRAHPRGVTPSCDNRLSVLLQLPHRH